MLGLTSRVDIHSRPVVEVFTLERWFLDQYIEQLTMGTIIQVTTQVLVWMLVLIKPHTDYQKQFNRILAMP